MLELVSAEELPFDDFPESAMVCVMIPGVDEASVAMVQLPAGNLPQRHVADPGGRRRLCSGENRSRNESDPYNGRKRKPHSHMSKRFEPFFQQHRQGVCFVV
jgi:hypothetical protein